MRGDERIGEERSMRGIGGRGPIKREGQKRRKGVL